MIRIGIIGMGVMGKTFIRSLERFPEAKIVAICNRTIQTAEEYAVQYGAKAYSDYHRMFDDINLDAVLICTPDHLHYDSVKCAVDAGAHIFLEKPLATDSCTAKKIADLAENYEKVFFVGHTLRFDPRFVNGYKSIQNGEIGDILHIRSWRETSIDNGIRLGGRCSSMFFVGVHDIDIMLWYSGAKVERVFGEARYGKLKNMGIDTPDAVFALMKFTNGMIATLNTSWVLPKTQRVQRSNVLDKGMEIVGEKGVISIEAYNIGMTVQTEDNISYPDILYSPDMHGSSFGIYSEEMFHFLKCIETGMKPATSVIDSLEAVRIAEAIEVSAKKNLPITL